jgi:hypothetical protein
MRSAVLAMAIVGIGCGSSGSGSKGGGNFSTSVPGNKSIASLTPSEQGQLCHDLDQWSQTSLAPSTCQTSAVLAAALGAVFDSSLSDAQIQMSCTQAYNECLASNQSADAGATSSCQMGVSDPTCTATVSEITACLNDQSAVFAQEANALPSCGSLTRANLSTAAGGDSDAGAPDEPASCKTVDMKCPNFSMPATPNAFRR